MNVSRKNLIIILTFSIYFLVGIFIYKDFGIGIEEHFQRQNGFYWLKEILSFTNFENLKELTNQKYQNILLNNPDLPKASFFNFYGILFDLPVAFIEIIFNLESSKIYFEIRHVLNFIVFFISSIFFYKILFERFNFTLTFFGLLIYILTPRIFGDSFHNNKDVFFLSLFTIALYYCFQVLKKDSYKNIIIFCIFAAFATSSRIIGIFFPFSILIFYFFEFLAKRKEYKKIIIKSFSILFFFSLFLFLHFPYTWTLNFTNFLNWLDPFFFHMGINILFNGEYFYMKYLPMSYLPTWIFITTPFFYLFLFITGTFFLLIRLFKRIISIKEISVTNDLWRGINEKKDIYVVIFFLVFFFYAVFFNVAMVSGWRFFYFLHVLMVYISVFSLHIFYIRYFKNKKFFFNMLIILPIIFTSYQIFYFHPYQSLYFNLLINSSNVKNFQVDTPSLSRVDALKNILFLEKSKKTIYVGNASWTPFGNGKDLLKIADQKKFQFVGQEYDKADYIYTNFIYEVNTEYNKKYRIPNNFVEIEKLIINEIPIYSLYKRVN